MNDKQVKLFYRFIVMQQNHWVLYMIVYLLMISIAIRNNVKAPGMHMWFLIGFVPFLLYLVRTYVNRMLLLWGAHIVMAAAMLLLPVPNTQYKLIFTAVGLFYCINSILKQYRGDDMEQPITILVSAAVGFIAMICLEYLKSYDFQQQYLLIFILNIALFFIAVYVQRFQEYLLVNKHSVGYMPIQNVFLGDIRTIGLFLGIISAIFLVILYFDEMNALVQYPVYYLKLAVTAVLKFILGLFKQKEGEVLAGDDMELASGKEMLQAAETNPLWDIIFTVLLISLALYFVYKIIRILPMLLALFRHRQKSATVEEEMEDVLEIYEDIEVNKKKRFSLVTALSPRERIRRRYKKKVIMSQDMIASEGKRSEMSLYTARECSNILETDEMGDIYEKARYSPYECTAEDVKNMKKACAHVRKY